MTQSRDFKTIEKLKRENKELESLLESAEAELKAFLAQSQEESQQLQKVLQSVYPRIRERMEKVRNEMKNVEVQTDDDQKIVKNLDDLQECFNDVEIQVVELMKSKKRLEAECFKQKEVERKLEMEVEAGGIRIRMMQEEIDEALNLLNGVKDLDEFIDAQGRFDGLCGIPASGLMGVFNEE